MILLDLFSGIGGFSLAAKWCGWQTAAFVEKDKFCQSLLKKNFPKIPIYEDIYEFKAKDFAGTIDIISGGFPCQPFSAAGKRKGKTDERHLWPEMFRVIQEVCPRWVVAENVRGLLTIENGETYAEIVAQLESAGFEVVTFCIPASSVNAPHRRDRLWIVGHSNKFRSQRPQNAQSITKRVHTDQKGAKKVGQFKGSNFAWHNYANNCTSDAQNSRIMRREGISKNHTKVSRSRAINTERSIPTTWNSDAANSTIERLQKRRFTTFCKSKEETEPGPHQKPEFNYCDGADNERNWIETATVLCGTYDGLSVELDKFGTVFNDNRNERIKALGNSVVPQVVYQLFQAIQQTENK